MVNASNIILIVLAGSMIMFLLIMVIITFTVTYSKRMHKKDVEHKMEVKSKELEMLRAVIKAEETEREKIAMNIHDEVGPLLSTLRMNMSRNKMRLEKGTLEPDHLVQENQFLKSVAENVRRVSHDLSPQFLMKYGVVKALESFCEGFEEPAVKVESEFEDDIPVQRNIRNQIYCTLMELINNLIKHDTPTAVRLRFEKCEDSTCIKLIHNGKGITNEEFEQFVERSTGLGLTNIKTRVLIINGKLDFEKGENESTTVLRIPFYNEKTD